MGMRIALLQTKQNRLYDFADAGRRYSLREARALQQEMVEQTLALLEGIDAPCDLIVTPEAINFPGSPEHIEGEWTRCIAEAEDMWLDAFAAQSKRLGSYLVLGAYTRRAGKVYNSACIYDRMGQRIALYDKMHLAGSEQRTLEAGHELAVIDADFGRFGVCICWDMQFPEVCRLYALAGARLVVCPTWGWEGIYAHARAYENGIFVAGAMGVPYQGDIEGIRNPSEVVGPDGTVRVAASRDRAEVVFVEIDITESGAYRALRMADRRPALYGGLFQERDTK